MKEMRVWRLDDGEPYEIVDGKARTDIAEIKDVIGSVSGSFPIVDMTEETATLDHTVYYRFGTVTSLTLTLNGMDDTLGFLKEWQFEFIAGEGFTTLDISPAISWVEDPVINVGRRYLVSIDNNRIGVIASVEVPA